MICSSFNVSNRCKIPKQAGVQITFEYYFSVIWELKIDRYLLLVTINAIFDITQIDVNYRRIVLLNERFVTRIQSIPDHLN